MNFFAYRHALWHGGRQSVAADAIDYTTHDKHYHHNHFDPERMFCSLRQRLHHIEEEDSRRHYAVRKKDPETSKLNAECEEVVSRYTNPDGTKKPGWMKSPNGQPSNLPECLWLIVRTALFKKWFGNWELHDLQFEVLPLSPAEFTNKEEGVEWAETNGIICTLTDKETGGKGSIRISKASVDKMLHGSAMRKSADRATHLAALTRLPEIIRLSHVCETHPDFKKGNGVRSPEHGINPNVEIAVMYGMVSLGGKPYRVKTTLKRHLDNDEPTKAYSYEISNIEILPGNAEPVALPNGNISMSANIVLKNVVDVNGQKLLDLRDPLDDNGEPTVSAIEQFLNANMRA